MTTQDVLTRVYHLIQNPEHWTTGALARDAKGDRCATDSDEAVQFSLAGAIDRVVVLESAFGLEGPSAKKLGEILALRLGHRLADNGEAHHLSLDLIMAFNDLADHKAVVGLIREAVPELQ